MRAYREAHPGENELKKVGLKQVPPDDVDRLPLHKLSIALSNVLSTVPLTSKGIRVVPVRFDPYQNSIIAPDHFLVGIIQNAVQAVLTVMTPSERVHVDALLRDLLTRAHYFSECTYFDVDGKCLRPMKFSTILCTFIFIPWATRSACKLLTPTLRLSFSYSLIARTVHSSYLLRRLFISTFHLPYSEVDGTDLASSIASSRSQTYFSRLQEQVYSYVSSVNDLYGSHDFLRKALDQPNVHRLVELYVHTLPLFGRVSLVREIILKQGHQPIKRAIMYSKNQKEHLHAMKSVLSDDRKMRLGIACSSVTTPGSLTTEECIKILDASFGAGHLLRDGTVTPEQVSSCFNSFVLSECSILCPDDLNYEPGIQH